MANTQHRCVFVGNIPYDATEEQLVQICEEVGPVVSFRLVLDRETGKPKGYGFCEYKDEETALSARRNLQGYEINGRQLRVDFAENDKGAERNREQGRGGPGLTSSLDAHKSLAGPGILGDSSLNQPIGLPLAATAASVMAGALGDPQTSSGLPLNQNGFQNQSGLGNDPLTLYLAKMSRNQLYEVMSEMKALAKQNQALARQLLLASSQLPKALFQAQIILGMVTPQVLQMPNIRQPSSSHLLPPLQDGQQDEHPVGLPAHLGVQIPPIQNKVQVGLLSRMPEGQLPIVPQNILIPQPPVIPLQSAPPMQPRFLLPQLAQTQVPLPTTLPGQPGVSTVSSLRPLPITGFPVRPQMPSLIPPKALKQQMQPPLLQPPRPMGAATAGNVLPPSLQNAGLQHSLLTHTLSSQVGPSNSSMLVGGLEVISREPGSSVPILNSNFSHDAARAPKIMTHSNTPSSVGEQLVMVNETSEVMAIPSKVPKVENGTSASRVTVSSNTGVGSVPPSAFGTSSISGNRIPPSDGMQHIEQHVPQLPPDVESALLKQVMSLTSEQLSSLPPEQRQQVIQLQQMLR